MPFGTSFHVPISILMKQLHGSLQKKMVTRNNWQLLWLTWLLVFVSLPTSFNHSWWPLQMPLWNSSDCQERLTLKILNFQDSQKMWQSFQKELQSSHVWIWTRKLPTSNLKWTQANLKRRNGTQKRLNLSLKKTKSNLMTLTRLKSVSLKLKK